MSDKQEITYEDMIAQIEAILTKFKKNEVSVDDLAKETKRATELITLCRDRLTSAERDLKKILE